MAAIKFIEAYTIIKPLAIFVLTMSIYAIFIFKFYRFLATKNIFEFNLKGYNKSEHPIIKLILNMIFYVLEYIILMPIFIFIWFAILAILLTFLAKNQPLESILLVALAIVGAVRITSYYNEDLSKDLAKMLPFALLGVFLVDISFFNMGESIKLIKTITLHTNTLVYYLGFIIMLEIFLRILYVISFPFLKDKTDTKNKEEIKITKIKKEDYL